ncbi:MAG: hypothetical protein QXF56_04360 [Candidatus Micrarchaeia archaeon]
MSSAFATLWSSWQSVAVAAAVLSILFAALAYALSHVFGIRRLEVWAKDELYQALASAFIVGAAIIIVTAIANFSCTVTGKCTPGQDHVDVAIGILNKLKLNVTKQVEHIFNLSIRVGMITNMGKFYDFTVGPEGGLCIIGQCRTAFGFSWYLWKGGSMVLDSLEYTFSVLLPMLSSIIAQWYMLTFIKQALFPSLLAMGIILRTFFFSRRVGGLLIAIALALYTIYPLLYVMLESYFTFNAHTFYYTGNDPNTWACTGNFLPEGDGTRPFCTGVAGLVVYVIPGLPQAVANYWDPSFLFKNGCVSNADCPGSSCTTIVESGESKHLCGGYGSDVYAGMMTPYNGVLPTVGYLMVPGTFLPLLIILVTISFIKVLSPQLGGDVEIAGLTRIL